MRRLLAVVGGHVDDPRTQANSVIQMGRPYRRMASIASITASWLHVYACTFMKSTCVVMRATRHPR